MKAGEWVTAALAAGAAGLLLTGCGGGAPGGAPAITPAGGGPVSSAAASPTPASSGPASAGSASASAAPGQAVAVGRSTTVSTGRRGGRAGSYTITVEELKSASVLTNEDGSVVRPDAGDRIVCVHLRVEDVASGGTTGSLSPFTNPWWASGSGRLSRPKDSGAECAGLGLTGDALSGQREPAPGQYVDGTVSTEVPKSRGALVFTDGAGAQLFRVPVAAG